MPRSSVGYHPAAFGEAQGAAAWYRERSPQAEAAFLAEIERAVKAISAGPERWPPYLQGSRRYLLHRFPFSVVYSNGVAGSRSSPSLMLTGAQPTGATAKELTFTVRSNHRMHLPAGGRAGEFFDHQRARRR
jgi:hypothetical protein